MKFRFFVDLPYQADIRGTVLVLSSYRGWKPALLLNSEGEQEELTCFEPDDSSEAYYSCSVNWKNQLHVFGGSTERQQISRLNGHELKRIGTLPFDHLNGACGVMSNQFIFLCFNAGDQNDWRRCRRSTGPLETFSEIAPSNHEHHTIHTPCSESKSSYESLNHNLSRRTCCSKCTKTVQQKGRKI